jgi:hypothetical protein
MITEPIIEPVIAPTSVSQARLLPRIYIRLRGEGDKYWGTVASLSRTRFTVFTHARFKVNTKVAVVFHFLISGKWLVTEELEAKAIWQSGDSAALEFNPTLAAGSPALKLAHHLGIHLAAREAGR